MLVPFFLNLPGNYPQQIGESYKRRAVWGHPTPNPAGIDKKDRRTALHVYPILPAAQPSAPFRAVRRWSEESRYVKRRR